MSENLNFQICALDGFQNSLLKTKKQERICVKLFDPLQWAGWWNIKSNRQRRQNLGIVHLELPGYRTTPVETTIDGMASYIHSCKGQSQTKTVAPKDLEFMPERQTINLYCWNTKNSSDKRSWTNAVVCWQMESSLSMTPDHTLLPEPRTWSTSLDGTSLIIGLTALALHWVTFLLVSSPAATPSR